MKKFIIALAAVFVLCVPAFATDYSDYFTQSFSVLDNFHNGYWYENSSYDDVYFCAVHQSDSQSDRFISYAVSSSENRTFTRQWAGFAGWNSSQEFTINSSSNGVFYYLVTPSSNYASSLVSPVSAFPYETSISDITTAFNEFLNSSGGGGSSTAFSFTVPAGNVLYFKVSSEQDISLVASMPVLSNIIGSPWSSGVQFGEAASLPTSSTTFPILSQSDVTFTKSTSVRNILGQTKTGIATKHCIVGQYYALYCPFHYGDYIAYGTGSSNYQSGNAGIIGASVNVSGSLTDIRVYPLSQRVSENALGNVSLISGSDDDYTSYYDGTVDSNGNVTWLDQNGDVGTPSVGGQNYVPDDVSTESVVQQIKNILNNIISEIKSLFSFGYEAVNSLVGIMRDFVSSFAQLYTWLPAPVYSALISAVTIAIVIGVFKVFL